MTAPVAVIGGGSAGTMAVLRCVLNNTPCLFFPGSPKDRKRSRAAWVRKIENMPAHFGYARGIEDPDKETLAWIAGSPFGHLLTTMKNTGITGLSRDENGVFTLVDDKGATHHAQYVVLCTGVMDVQPLIGGDMAPILPYANLQSVDYCLRCDGHHVLGKRLAVIGHTTAAAWVAVMLHERYAPPETRLLLNGEASAFDGEVAELLKMYGIRVHGEALSAVLGDPKAGKLEGFKLGAETVTADIAFVSLGMRVYNQLAAQAGATLDPRGFVVTDAQGLTSVPGLYAAGDVIAGTKKQVYTAWDTAVNAMDAINQKLRAAKRAAALAEYRARG